MYYIFIKENQINGCGQATLLGDNVINYEVTEELYNKYMADPDLYIWNEAEQAVIIDPDYEAKREQKEKERIGMLSLTRGDVFRGLLQAKGVTRSQLRSSIENNQSLTDVQKEMALIDFDEALNFYRGNSLIDTVGASLGITSKQLDEFFETNDYTKLV